MKSVEVIEQFMEETGANAADMIVLLADWFDEHDSMFDLQEFLQFARENNPEYVGVPEDGED